MSPQYTGWMCSARLNQNFAAWVQYAAWAPEVADLAFAAHRAASRRASRYAMTKDSAAACAAFHSASHFAAFAALRCDRPNMSHLPKVECPPPSCEGGGCAIPFVDQRTPAGRREAREQVTAG